MNRKKIFSIIIAVLLILSLAFNVYNLFEGGLSNLNLNKEVSDGYSPSYEYGKSEDYSSNNSTAQRSDTEMLVMNAGITITVDNNKTIDEQVRSKVREYGGKLVSSYDYQFDKTQKVYTLQVKVPQEKYEEFIDYLKNIGKTDNFSENSYDVYDQYQDNALRITMLNNKLDRLYELLKQAKDVNDLIILENYISDTIYQIESFKSIQSRLEYETDYASVSITIKPVVKEVVEPSGLQNLFPNAFTNSLNAFLKFIEWFVRILFFVLPYVILTGIGYFIYRKTLRRNK